ncbi:MAG: TadE/TadG family type IV pilus assembly protein [Bacillota bacterium]|nr:TadE/TadG family type IV pilus assembly protein [Bacillota bacterium]
MRLVREEKGQAIVEFALVVSLFLLMMLGMITFGQLLNAQLSVTYLAREGARLAALGGTDQAVISAVQSLLPPPLDVARLNVQVAPAVRPRGTPITVSVTYRVDLNIPLVVTALGRDHINLLGTTTMVSEI